MFKTKEEDDQSSTITKLLIRWAHKETLHGGPNAVKALLQQRDPS